MLMIPTISKSSSGKYYIAHLSIECHHDYHGVGTTIQEAIKDLQFHINIYNEMIADDNKFYNGNIRMVIAHEDKNNHLMVNVLPRIHYDGTVLTIRLTGYSDIKMSFKKREPLQNFIKMVNDTNKWYFNKNLENVDEYEKLAI